MSATPLTDQLFRDADAEVARRVAVARAEADRLEAAGALSLAAERGDALRARAHALGTELERAREERNRRRHFDLLAARRRLVDRAIEVAMRRAPEIVDHPAVASAMQRILRHALAYLPEGDGTVRCHPLVVPALQEAGVLRGATIASDEALPFGFVVESRDGRVRVDATLETLMAREREALAIALVRRHAERRP